MIRPALLWLVCLMPVAVPALCPGQTEDDSQVVSQADLVRVYRLQNLNCREIYQVIQQLFPDATIAVDQRSNSLVIRANMATMENIGEQLDSMEKLAETASASTQVVQLQEKLDRNCVNFLQQYASMENVQLAVQPDSGLLLVDGRPEQVAMLKTLIQQLQVRSATAAETRPVLVRLLWLREGVDSDTELEEVARINKQMSRLGIKNLGVVGQLACRCDLKTAESSSFSIKGTDTLETSTAQLKVAGSLRPLENSSAIEGKLMISVSSEDAEPIEFEVDANLKLDRMVVLASSPYQGRPSVFVVQLLSESEDRQVEGEK